MRSRTDILKSFLDKGFMEGHQIPNSYFWELFGLVEPKGQVHVKVKDKAQFDFMSCMERLKKDLLEEHKADLQSTRRRGYFLVPYKDRTPVAIRDTTKSLRKGLNDGYKRLTNIPNPENLSYTEQRQRDYALQMIDAMKRDLRAAPRYPK